jgi:hypothetical protein
MSEVGLMRLVIGGDGGGGDPFPLQAHTLGQGNRHETLTWTQRGQDIPYPIKQQPYRDGDI